MNTRRILNSINYKFSASNKTVTFEGLFPPVFSGDILMIINITRNVVLYNFASTPDEGGVYANGTMTLTGSTSGMADGDKLMVIVIEKKDRTISLLEDIKDRVSEANEWIMKLYENQQLKEN